MGLLTFLRGLFCRKNHLKDMLLAVDEEISWVRKKGSGKRVRLYDGERRSSTAELFYYVFKLDEELRGLGRYADRTHYRGFESKWSGSCNFSQRDHCCC